MVRKTSDEDKSFLTFDEPVADKAAILAAVADAESKELYEYGMLTQRYYLIMQNGQINTSINRSSFVATKEGVEKILNKMDRTRPKVEYEIAKFGDPAVLKP